MKSVLQFRVKLLQVDPPIWRRIQVLPDDGLPGSPRAVQDSMDWEDRHVHAFRVVGSDLAHGLPEPRCLRTEGTSLDHESKVEPICNPRTELTGRSGLDLAFDQSCTSSGYDSADRPKEARRSQTMTTAKQALAFILALLVLTTLGTAQAGPIEDATAAFAERDYGMALGLLRPLAEQGDADAQHNLGVMYASGQGVPQDYVEAAKWFRLAAEQGLALAQYNLGVAYENGQGVPQDYAEAMRLYRLASDQGDASAQLNLGQIYHDGRGIPRDYVLAVKWIRLAAEQGDAVAQNNLGVAYADGKGLPQDDALAVKWYRLAAEQGDAKAQSNLGQMYHEGRGVQKDYALAVKWIRLAAEQGYAKAQYNLGAMYYAGEGVRKDHALAVKWYSLASEQGYASAQFNLGLMYGKGEGAPQDYVKAYLWSALASSDSEIGNQAVRNRDYAASLMTPAQVAEAQRLARKWKPIAAAALAHTQPMVSNVVAAPEDFVLIPAGTFQMGSPTDELGRSPNETLHTVTLTQGFYIARTEVTEELWDVVMGSGSSTSQLPKGDLSWDDTVAFCNQLSLNEGLTPAYVINGPEGDVTWSREANGYRLPTEAEWEYACRAGSQTAFCNGPITFIGSSPLDPSLNDVGWYGGNVVGFDYSAQDVGQKAPNAWGLYDMHGNVWEQCWDWYGEYTSGTVTDPQGPSTGSKRVYRGGGRVNEAKSCRSGLRGRGGPSRRNVGQGFRVVRNSVQ